MSSCWCEDCGGAVAPDERICFHCLEVGNSDGLNITGSDQ